MVRVVAVVGVHRSDAVTVSRRKRRDPVHRIAPLFIELELRVPRAIYVHRGGFGEMPEDAGNC